jgi:hypothetical protein
LPRHRDGCVRGDKQLPQAFFIVSKLPVDMIQPLFSFITMIEIIVLLLLAASLLPDRAGMAYRQESNLGRAEKRVFCVHVPLF